MTSSDSRAVEFEEDHDLSDLARQARLHNENRVFAQLLKEKLRNASIAEHDLYTERKGEKDTSADEPPVLWTATVFRANESVDDVERNPLAIYHDDRPLDMSSKDNKKDSQHLNPVRHSEEDLSSSAQRPSWTGCVFEVACRATAQFPRSKKSRSMISEFESLNFDWISRKALLIKSPYLYDTLKDIAEYYPAFFAQDFQVATGKPDKQKFEIPDPWGILFHRFTKLEAFVESHSSINEIEKANDNLNDEELALRIRAEHASHLCGFLKPFYVSHVLPCRRALQQPNPQITFDMLWYVFAPGTDVYVHSDRSFFACVVAKVMSNIDDELCLSAQVSQRERSAWILDLWYLECDGQRIGRIPTTCRISAYSGPRALTDLEACPAAIWDASDNGKRRQAIMKRSILRAKSLQRGHLLAWHNGVMGDGKRHVSCTLPCRLKLTLDSTRGVSLSTIEEDYSTPKVNNQY